MLLFRYVVRVFAICAVISVAACGGAQQAQQGGGMVQPVSVVTLKSQPLVLTQELPGRTTAYLVAEVRPQVNGIIKKRLFTEGGSVKAGQVLYEIEDALYRAEYNNAEASLARAQASLEVARLAANRSAELRKIDAVSAQDDENAIASLKQAEADVASAKAAIESTRVNLDYTRITAPISGRIGKSSVTVGALVTANQSSALATVQQLDPVYVDVNQSSSEWLDLRKSIDAGRVKSSGPGTPVKIVLEDGSTLAQEGKLQFADVSVDPETGSFLLRVLVPNANETLLPGMYVRALVNAGVRNDALLAPQRGISRDPRGGASAFVVNADNKVEQRTVNVSQAIGDQWLVEEGLRAGDRVIVEGLQKVQPGASVQASEAGEAAQTAAAK